MKKYRIIFIIVLLFLIFGTSVSAANDIFIPSWSTAVIDYINTSDVYGTDAFHFNNGSVTLNIPNTKKIDMLDLAVSSFTLNNNYDDLAGAFYISYEVNLEVIGDPGVISCFYSGNSDDIELVFQDHLTDNKIYSINPGTAKISSNGSNFYELVPFSLVQFASSDHIYFQFYFRIAASFTNSGFDPWLRFYGAELLTPTNGFTINITSSKIFYNINESGLLNVLTPPIDGSGFENINDNLQGSIENFESNYNTFFDNLTNVFNTVSSGASLIFNLILVPLSDISFSTGGLNINILTVVISFAFIYFVIAIVWLIFALSGNKGSSK